MKIAPINNINFGKLYIKNEDYSSVQSQYLCDISTKLNRKYGEQKSYSEKLEDLGYDIWATSAYKNNNIRLMLTKKSKNNHLNEAYRGNTVASLGEFSTDFNPQKAVNLAEISNKVDSILAKVLLGIAGVLTILAIWKGCSETKAIDKTSQIISNKIENVAQNMSNKIKLI